MECAQNPLLLLQSVFNPGPRFGPSVTNIRPQARASVAVSPNDPPPDSLLAGSIAAGWVGVTHLGRYSTTYQSVARISVWDASQGTKSPVTVLM